MSLTFKTLYDTSIASFCDGADDAATLAAQLARSIATGSVHPEWCWLAWNSPGQILSRHNWWGLPGSVRPIGVDLLSAEDHDASVAMLAHARDHLDVYEARSEITTPIGRGDDPSSVRAPLVAVLKGSGFHFAVARVTVQWTPGIPLQPLPNRLVFLPANGMSDDLLVSLFTAVSDDSLDHGMQFDRARFGADEEARQRLKTVRSYEGASDWFSVAFTQQGEPVGYVVPAVAGDLPIVAEIGIAAAYRGHHYVDDLLSWATDILQASGAERIVADTDRVNTPMRAAFGRAGYKEFRWRDDYRWIRGQHNSIGS